MMLATVAGLLGILLLLLAVGCLLLTYRRLQNVPGPFLANFTNFWRAGIVYEGSSHNVYLRLHRKHGSAVRIGPNCVSLSSLEALQAIYSISAKFPKVRLILTHKRQRGILMVSSVRLLRSRPSHDQWQAVRKFVQRNR
jgi:hypothetical protein